MFDLVPRNRGSIWGHVVTLALLFFGGFTLFIGHYSGHPSFDAHEVDVPVTGTMSLWFAVVGGLALLAGIAALLKAEVGRFVAVAVCVLAVVIATDRALPGMPAGGASLAWIQHLATVAGPQILVALGILTLAVRHWPHPGEPEDRIADDPSFI